MRTHHLSELEIEGREKVLQLEPLFDFYKIRKAHRIVIDFYRESLDSQKPDVIITAEYKSMTSVYELIIRIEGVHELVLPDMKPFLHLTELEVEDIRDRMLEGMNFEIIAQYENDFRCLCRGIEIVSFAVIPHSR